jgi:Zn-dependent M16 (insulinase) family peptidase
MENKMKFEIGGVYHGFALEREERIDEINCTGRIFTHSRCGARLCYLDCDEDNKVFAIGFRTPPMDSTGAPHILEHSVLCGSRKFPSKEPFVELAKGSLHTFLNAMTYPDKTIYPVASKNEQDLFNLMDVYLDAVFHPNIYRFPEIFMQEGWHHELDSRPSEITLKGVVYNEMRGAYSTPEEILFRKIQESLFPDTAYGFESGGDPDIIPELSYESFISFHRRYYHPQNSYIFLYGNVDIGRALRFLNNEYLGEYSRTDVVCTDNIRRDIDTAVTKQKPFSSRKELVFPYPISREEDTEDKTYFSLNWVIDVVTNPKIYMAFSILEHMLLQTPAAPLKIELLKRRIGKDVLGSFDRSILQPTFSLVLKNSNKRNKDEFIDTVTATLQDLVNNGIDKRLIEASVNIHEFRLREADFRGFPKGLVYYIVIMDSWQYGGDPFQHLRYEPTLNQLKGAVSGDYFERLIDRHLLENTHSTLVVLTPKKGLEEEWNKRTKKRLEAFRAELKEREITELVESTNRLKQRQTAPDPEEALLAIPLLGLDDIEPEAERLPLEERDEGGIRVLAHPIFTSRIAYLNLLFDTGCVPQSMLPYLSLLSTVMARVSTSKYSYSELSKEINIHTGGIGFDTQIFSGKDSDEVYYPKLVVKAKAMTDKLEKLFELLSEIIGGTRFDETARLLEIVQETKSRMEIVISEAGHMVSTQRLFSYFSPLGKFTELLSGMSYYKFIADLERHFEVRKGEISESLAAVARLVFNSNNLIISLTGMDEEYPSFQQHVPTFIQYLSDAKNRKQQYEFEYSVRNEGLLTPGKVQFVAKGYNFRRLGYDYSGTLDVLCTIASLDFLWSRIRVQGGAYGSMARFSRNGNMFFCSYRDPNLKETLGVYDEAYSYISSFGADERELRKYIIGTIGAIDSPLTPSMKGEVASAHYISGIIQEEIQKRRDEVLGTKKEDIKRCAEMVRDAMRQNFICVIGSEAKLRENKELFSTLVPVFE